VQPGTTESVTARATADSRAIKKKHIEKELAHVIKQINHIQDRLNAEGKKSLLVVLQAMDAGGKDGVVKHVFGQLNPQGVRVTSFKSPTPEERAHDFLWRVHPHVPRKGDIGIFNRSHYEDVLWPVVHDVIPIDSAELERRYKHIRNFEDLLVDNNTTVIKFFLNMSKAEQKNRLLARQQDPEKQWKLTPDDASERKLWSKYMEAYDRAIVATSTEQAPWYVIPADDKPFARLMVAKIVLAHLSALSPQYPPALPNVASLAFDD